MRPVKNRRGAILVVTLLVLALITVMGIFGATRASMEANIAANAKWKTVAFFASEAGLNHAKELLIQRFVDANSTTGGGATWANWTFLLDDGVSPATYYHCEDCDTALATTMSGDWLNGGVQILTNTVTSGPVTFTYTVTAWDNWEQTYRDVTSDTIIRDSTFFCQINGTWDDGFATTYEDDEGVTGGNTAPTVNDSGAEDCDSTIIIRSVATATISGSTVATSVQELSVSATTSGEAITESTAREGKGSEEVDLTNVGAGSGTITPN